MNEIEQLVESLYVPRNADEIKDTQRRLQAQQRGPHGWEMARQLLRSNSSNCQFFGALTYAVQINARADSGESGSEEDQRLVVTELLSWLVGIRGRAEGKAFVVQKLLSVISLAFMRYPYAWRCPLGSVAATVASGAPVLDVAPGHVPQATNTTDMELVLMFAKTLAEDLSRPGGFVGEDMKLVLRGIIEDDNMDVVSTLLTSALQQGVGLDCLNSWIVYGCTADAKKILGQLSELNNVLLHFVQTDQLFEEAAKLVYDVLESSPTFFSREWKIQLLDLYMGEWGQNTWLQFSSDIETYLEAAEWYVKLLCSVCDSYSDHVLTLISTQKLVPGGLLSLLLKLSVGIPGYAPMEDENVSSELLDYWMGLLDTLYDNQGKTDSELVDSLLLEIASTFWTKIRLPDLHETVDMKEFRRDVGDLLESVCNTVPDKLLSNLSGIVNSNLASGSPDWSSIEAALFGLIAINDYDSDDSAVVSVCNDPSLLQQISLHPSVRLRKTAITFVGVYDSKYVHGACLGPALDFLFASLGEASLALFASRSISKLCSDGRKSLGGMLSSFFQVYESMASSGTVSSYCHENTVEGIAAIIESEPPEKQSEYLSRLIDILVDRSQKELTMNVPDDPIVSLFKCLICIGKKLQSSEELDLETSGSESELSVFWNSDPHQVRHKLLTIITTFAIQQEPYNTSAEICDLACVVFRKGFSEQTGPFVFSTELIYDFISTKFNQNRDFGPPVVKLASCYMTSIAANDKDPKHAHFVKEIINLFFQGPNSILAMDDDIAHLVIQLVEKIATSSPLLFFVHTPEELLHSILSYCIQALLSTQILVISTSTSFWANFCTLKLQTGEAKERHAQIMKALGPSLVSTILLKVCGDGARSSLLYYSSVLRKYIYKHPMDAKHNIEAFFTNPETKPKKASDQDVKIFVAKIINLRGQKLTDSVVKEFWVTCSGSGLDYLV